ncbi:MAG TPA: cytochrome c oxidase assembly protein [Rhodanobacteraceae bacterium]|nr:cytochrome c oxidase assembly protein [Rhodanobacteraceae bacterium]
MLHILIEWTWEPWLLACIVLATVPYVVGMVRMGRAQRVKILGRRRALSYLTGMVILLLALESPLDALADDLFSAHMAQHMLLLLVIPALLVYGRPVITWLWAFDLGTRRGIVRGWKRSGLQAVFDWLTRPLVVWVLLSAALCVWHLPGPYDWAVRHEWLHDLEHLSFLGFSLAFWTIVIEPYGQRRRLGFGATIVFVVSSGFVMGLIGAVLTFAAAPLYAVHLHTTQAYGLTPLQDQELAGVIMWIPSNLVHLAALCSVFFAWYRADQQGGARSGRAIGERARARVRPSVVVPIRGSLRPALILVGVLAAAFAIGVPNRASAHQSEAQHGARLIQHYGCGSCHTIPGINGANGLVGPPLTHWSQRSYIAGVLPNDPSNLAFWIQHPQEVIKGVDMPDMGIKEREAAAIAAYLDTIK